MQKQELRGSDEGHYCVVQWYNSPGIAVVVESGGEWEKNATRRVTVFAVGME